MERFDCRLYSGPLSLEAQKILEALQAQRRQATRQIHRYYKHNHPLENDRYDSQLEPLSQSYASQQQERNAHPSSICYNSQWPDSGPLAYSQSSQALDFSQASCSSWEPSLRSRTNPNGPHYLVSQMYSQRTGCGPPALLSSQTLPFSQTNACSSQVERYSLTLQTPQGLSEHPIKAQERSEEMTPQFTIEFPSDDETPGQKDMTEPLFPSCLGMTGLVKSKRPPADRNLQNTESFYQHQPTTTIRLNPSLEKELKCRPHLNQMLRDAPENSQQVEEKKDIYIDTKCDVPVVELEDALLPCDKSNPLTSFEATADLTHERQPERCDVTKTTEIPSVIQSDSSDVHPISAAVADGRNTGESKDVMEVESEVAAVKHKDDVQVEALTESCSNGKLGTESDNANREFPLADKIPTLATINNSQSSGLQLEVSHCPAPVIPRESHDNTLTNPAVGEENTHLHLVNTNTSPHNEVQEQSDSKRNMCEDVEESTMTSSSNHGYSSSSAAPSEGSKIMPSNAPHRPYSKPSFISLKRKYEAPQSQSNNILSKAGSAKRPLKWKPPQLSQEQKRQARKEIDHSKSENSLEGKPKCNKTVREVSRHASSSDCTPPKMSKYISKHDEPLPEILPPDFERKEVRNLSKPGSLTSSLTSDPRVTDASKMNKEEIDCIVKKAQTSEAVVLTLVFRDGTTQLDPEQKLTPPMCGLLLLIRTGLDNVSETLGPNDRLVYFKLEHAPAWAQQPTPHRQQTVTRDLLLQVFLGSQLLVCYKAKDVLQVILQLYKRELTWKQVVGCQLHDPQVSGWLLDPADPASCFQDLLNKHCRLPRTTPALGSKKVSQIIAGLCSLYKLNRELGSKLQSQGLWGLYSDMELKMIPVLAAMEVCHIHVDKEALRRTSDLLGTKMRQLEQEAHKAAGQKFLLTSSTQLRTVIFEKLRLHERCENKKLPKTINKQQSTSEAALLQLQDLHPLPKIILEYRQIHKIKSTFVDGILSCMMTKSYISSTWHQTSVVTGRISAKHPNFQALPRQPLQVTRTLYIAGKDEEVVTVHPRAMFIPKEGWTFLSADFCQVELRLLAHLSSDPELLRVFTSPEADVFSMLASQWKGVSETEVTSEDREHAKRIVYSVVYGAGSERLSGILGVSAEQARRFQDSFLQTYKEVQTFIQKTVTECQNKGYVLSIMGRRRTLHNINSPDWAVRMQAERQAVNFVVQGSAADLCKMAMIRIFSLLSTSSSLSARLVAQLHDELLYEVEDSQLEEFAAVVKSTMESLACIDQLGVRLKVPLKVAVSSGKSWGSMSELSVPRDIFLK